MSVGIPQNSVEIGPVPDSTADSVSDPAPGRSCYANALPLAQATLHNLRTFIILWAVTCPTLAYADTSPMPALTSDTSPYLFWLLMILLGAAAYIYLSHREKKLADHDPDPWTEPEFLDSILLLAREQGAQLRLQTLPTALDGLPQSKPTSQSDYGPCVSSVCVHFDSTRLIVVPEKTRLRPAPLPHSDQNAAVSPNTLGDTFADTLDSAYIPLPALDFAPSSPLLFQPGQGVRVDFCIKIGGENRTFQFDTLVLRNKPPAPNEAFPPHAAPPLLELARPTRVARFQRRTFERIRPHRADVAALGVWGWTPGPTLPSTPGDASTHLLNFDDVGPSTPPLAMLPGCRENVRLDNISATGIALRVRAATLAETRTHGEKWRGCIIFLSLRESENHNLMLWLACVRRHATVSASRPSSAVLGWEIAGWAETPDAQAPIAWKPTASCGETPPLLRWIVRRLPMARRYRRINL